MRATSKLISFTCLTLATAAGSPASHAQCPNTTKILASDRQSGDAFGASATISRGAASGPARLLIGAWGDDSAAGVDVGSVYTFYLDSGAWIQASHIFAADAQPGDSFGQSVSVSDPGAIVGATGVGDTGAAYIFERSGGTWVQTGKIIPSGSQPQDDVGRAVAMNGTWLGVIGVPGRDIDLAAGLGDSDPDAGIVVLVHKVNGVWTPFQSFPTRLAANAGQYAGERYGAAVAAAGNLVICGAPSGEIPGWPANHGYVDVYRNYVLTDRLTAVGPHADDHFGSAVSTDGNSLAIGAPDDDLINNQVPGIPAKSNNGSVTLYVWDGEQWNYDGQIFAQDPADDARFGSSVAIDNDRVVVGAVGAKKAYVFRRVGVGHWAQVAMLSDPDDSANGSFARSVAIGAGQIAIGDRDDETASLTNHGAAYVLVSPDDAVAADACDGAGRIAGHGIYFGCTTSATLNGASSCGSGGANGYGPDVFYSWTPACSGSVTIDTIGSDYDTVLSVHSACPATAANTIACNDDAAGFGLNSQVTFNYTAGTTYLIRIAGFNAHAGNFILRVVEPAAPGNDTCNNALSVGNGTTVFDTCRATTNALSGPTCAVQGGEPVKDIWFRYTAPCNGAALVTTCGSNFDTVLQVFDAACPSLNAAAIGCNDDAPQNTCGVNTYTSAVQWTSVAGASYLIRVGGWDNVSDYGEVGHGLLNLLCTPACPCDWNQSGATSVQDIFDFLAAYFGGNGDFNASGATSVQDIFDFLACYFAGCP